MGPAVRALDSLGSAETLFLPPTESSFFADRTIELLWHKGHRIMAKTIVRFGSVAVIVTQANRQVAMQGKPAAQLGARWTAGDGHKRSVDFLMLQRFDGQYGYPQTHHQ